jgi:hypothetical protein
MLETARIECPYCGEAFDIEVDCSAGGQQYIEDCTVCCQPILVTTDCDNDGSLLSVTVRREND